METILTEANAEQEILFFHKSVCIRLSINLRAVAKADTRSLPPIAPRSNLTLSNTLTTPLIIIPRRVPVWETRPRWQPASLPPGSGGAEGP